MSEQVIVMFFFISSLRIVVLRRCVEVRTRP